jgi:uncharacterized protein YbcC (UPF0753/DUF2309 family)
MKASDEDSVRSRATAGLTYFIAGSAVCAAWVLLIYAGTTASPYWGGGSPVPVEMIAGLGAIVAFMGLVQLLIAWILHMRGGQ